MTQRGVYVTNNKRLEDLLDDDRFCLSIKPPNSKTLHSQECVDLYIKGELKECLEKMYFFELLSEEKMKTDIQSWYLLMNCISQISSVSILGTSLQRS